MYGDWASAGFVLLLEEQHLSLTFSQVFQALFPCRFPLKCNYSPLHPAPPLHLTSVP